MPTCETLNSKKKNLRYVSESLRNETKSLARLSFALNSRPPSCNGPFYVLLSCISFRVCDCVVFCISCVNYIMCELCHVFYSETMSLCCSSLRFDGQCHVRSIFHIETMSSIFLMSCIMFLLFSMLCISWMSKKMHSACSQRNIWCMFLRKLHSFFKNYIAYVL
jgi:hypothetical protein